MLGRIKRYSQALGPGIVTGASHNDPAEISTYSIAGASAGYTFLTVARGCQIRSYGAGIMSWRSSAKVFSQYACQGSSTDR